MASPPGAVASTLQRPAGEHKRIIRFASYWILAVIILFAIARILTPSDNSSAGLSIAGTSLTLPELCQFKRLVNIDCPGCGFTRSFVYSARFQISDAWSVQPVGTLLALTLAASIPYRFYQIHQARRGHELHSTIKLEAYTIILIAVLAYGRWFWQLT
jgi:hypothetical protein